MTVIVRKGYRHSTRCSKHPKTSHPVSSIRFDSAIEMSRALIGSQDSANFEKFLDLLDAFGFKSGVIGSIEKFAQAY